MNEFLGLSNFLIQKGNTAEQTDYYNIYQEVKQSIKLPLETLNKIYNSKYIQYFYQDEEINKFKEQWQE